ncbi:MAG: prenyltransferase/squalene oxidase repeat-containing protein [Planctomycetota bacterium]
MARDDYYDDYQDDGYDEEEAPPPAGDEDSVLKQTPWFAISLAFHAVLLLIIWSIVISVVEIEKPKVQPTAVEPPELPEPPKILPQTILPEDRPDVEQQDPTEDPRIVKDAADDHNEDPTNDPTNQDLRPNPNPDQSNVESPYPNAGFNSSIGLGGNIGGGGGPGGAGGFVYRRARGGGGHRGDQNVLLALKWLRDHQDEDGSWDPVNFAAAGAKHGRTSGSYGNKDGSGDTGWEHARAGLTGMALLAFLGAGYTHTEGEFADTVKKSLRYLKAVQDNDGCFDTTNREDPHFVYGHSICTMALSEAYGMTGANMLKGPAQKGVDFIAMAQNHDPDRGYLGWRYGVKPGDSDTSVTGWMSLALKSARVADLDVPQHCWDGAITHMKDMTGKFNNYPKTGYIQKAGTNARLQSQSSFVPNGSMDAINIMTRLFVSQDGSLRNDPELRGQADQLIEEGSLPTLSDATKLDYYYWYYASLALFQMGDRWWKRWEGPMGDSLIKSQRLTPADESDKCYGSWDSNSAWGIAGGRVYATAINCLTLEVYYRYEKIGNKGGH